MQVVQVVEIAGWGRMSFAGGMNMDTRSVKRSQVDAMTVDQECFIRGAMLATGLSALFWVCLIVLL